MVRMCVSENYMSEAELDVTQSGTLDQKARGRPDPSGVSFGLRFLV